MLQTDPLYSLCSPLQLLLTRNSYTAISISPNIELINNSWLYADCATVLACVQCKSIMPYCLLMNEILRDFLL